MRSIFENYLGKKVDVAVDRPLGSKHPKHDIIYEINYGYVSNTKAPDGEEIDVYILGVRCQRANSKVSRRGYCYYT